MLEMLRHRRSIRKFKPARIPDADVEALATAGLLAPSAKNTKEVEFIVVRDKTTLERLARCRDDTGAHPLDTATLGIVVVGRPGENAIWDVNAAIAATYVLIEAEARGLGCCWVQMLRKNSSGGQPAERLAGDVLNLTTGHTVFCVLALGQADETKPPYALDDLDRSRVQYR